MSSPVGSMFGRIAGVYDLLNHVLSLGIDIHWRRQLANLLPAGGIFLDLASGTMDVALAMRKKNPQARILAMDFCQPMLLAGLPKLQKAGSGQSILPCCANALCLPLAANSMDAVTIAFGIRNITERQAAFAEMLRVLKPGGRLCVLEFGSAGERILGGIYNFYLADLLPRIARAISRDRSAYEYLARTIREFPPAPALAQEMEKAGFGPAHFRKLTGGIVCLHWSEKPAKTPEGAKSKYS